MMESIKDIDNKIKVIPIENFKVKKDKYYQFCKLYKDEKYINLFRFLENPKEDIDYFEITFAMPEDLFLQFFNECIDKGIYYYC